MSSPIVLTALMLAGLSSPPAPRSVTHSIRTMGTYATIAIVSTDSLETLAPARSATLALTQVDSLMSNWTETSEVARINRLAANGRVIVQPQVNRVLAAAVRIGGESQGAFDITVEPLVRAWGFLGGVKRVPSEAEVVAARALIGPARFDHHVRSGTIEFDRAGVRIDLGGIAKGHAVDCAAESLIAHGVRAALVDVSGNMRAMGSPPGAPHWRIGLRDPRNRTPSLGRLALSDRAIATSGKYEQFVAQDGRTYGHILDPRSGRPASGLIAVTVIAEQAMEADAWGTALFVLGGSEARRVAATRRDLDVILIEAGADGVDTLWVESILRDAFELDPAAQGLVRVRYF